MPVRRKIHLLIISILLLSVLSACGNDPSSEPRTTILGAWRGDYFERSVRMVFDEEGKVFVVAYGGFQEGTYTTNNSVTPHQLDLTFPDSETIHTIYELTEDGALKIENALPGVERPGEFSDFILLNPDVLKPPE